MQRYYVDSLGDFLGSMDLGDPPVGSPPVGWIEVPTSPPTGLHRWDFIEEEWFLPFRESTLSEYLDTKIVAPVSHETFSVLNDDLTRKRLNDRQSALMLKPEGTMTLWETLGGPFNLTIGQIQGLFLACCDRLQYCYDAFGFVISNHAVTPYTTWDAAKADFDTKLDELFNP